jgi:hypothetical protein
MITGPITQGLHHIGTFPGTQEALKDWEGFFLHWVLHFGFLKHCTNISVILDIWKCHDLDNFWKGKDFFFRLCHAR